MRRQSIPQRERAALPRIHHLGPVLVALGALLLGSCGGGGGGSGAVGPAGFVYVTNEASETVSVYAISAGSGALVPVAGSPFATGVQPLSVAIDPSGTFAYVTNITANSISAYTIDPGTGALADVPGQIFAAGNGPASVAVHPSGNFLYAVNLGSTAGDISAYTIDADGAPRPLAGPNVVAGRNARSIAVDPSGKFAYVANNGSNDVSGYTIDTGSGALTPIDADPNTVPIDNFAAGTSPDAVAIHPSGKFAYVSNFGSNDVSAYTITPLTGVLVPIDADPSTVAIDNFPAPVGSHPFGVAFHPSGKFAYVPNNAQGTVSAYTVDAATGALTAIGNFPAGLGPQSVTVDPSGKFAYVANNGSNNVSAYTIDASSGALAPVAGSPFDAGTGPSFVTTRVIP